MISAVILAAGQSKRMGRPKMLLPWGQTTVIEHVIATFMKAGVEDIVVVTGGSHEQVERVTEPYPIRKIYNPVYETGEMLSSLQWGLRHTRPGVEAALVGLGDQPQVQERTVRLICEVYEQSHSPLIVPSFQRRRGHPWLVARSLWDELIAMESPASPRDFLHHHATEIQYLQIDSPSILADLDTPQDYEASHP